MCYLRKASLDSYNITMKKKFLIIGDNHLDSVTPQSRADVYMETGLAELRETLEIARDQKVDYYILLGDVFNRMDVGGVCRNRALEILLSDNGAPWPFEKYIVVGNHDIAHNMANLEKSALQTLISAGAVKYSETIPGLPVRFFHFSNDLDQRLIDGELLKCDEKIVFLHASIVTEPTRYKHVLFDDLQINPATKIICSGHIHARMEAINQDNVFFFNPSSLGRPDISDSYSNIDVAVLGIMYDFDTDNMKYKYFNLQSSLPYNLVFDLEKYNTKRNNNKAVEMFVQKATTMDFSDIITGNIKEDFITFAQKRNIKGDIIDAALEAVTNVQMGVNS